jgi:hypothetical protein
MFNLLYTDIQSPFEQFEIINIFSHNLAVYILISLNFLIALKLHMDIPKLLNPKDEGDKKEFFNRSFKPKDTKDDDEQNVLLVKLRLQKSQVLTYPASRLRGLSVYTTFILPANLTPWDIDYLNSLFINNTHPDYVVRPGRSGGLRLYNRTTHSINETYARPTQNLINAVQFRLLFTSNTK